jgi:hypothetical protein
MLPTGIAPPVLEPLATESLVTIVNPASGPAPVPKPAKIMRQVIP